MVKEHKRLFSHRNMSVILNYIDENHKETQRLIGVEYEQLQHLLQNAERLHHEKQALLESKKLILLSEHILCWEKMHSLKTWAS